MSEFNTDEVNKLAGWRSRAVRDISSEFIRDWDQWKEGKGAWLLLWTTEVFRLEARMGDFGDNTRWFSRNVDQTPTTWLGALPPTRPLGREDAATVYTAIAEYQPKPNWAGPAKEAHDARTSRHSTAAAAVNAAVRAENLALDNHVASMNTHFSNLNGLADRMKGVYETQWQNWVSADFFLQGKHDAMARIEEAQRTFVTDWAKEFSAMKDTIKKDAEQIRKAGTDMKAVFAQFPNGDWPR